MNDAPLPMLNGFPARLVVPGWYATYWMKALTEITVVDRPFQGFWMAPAYRIPDNPTAHESPQALSPTTVPINRLNVRSFFVRPEPFENIPFGPPCALEGIAFDGGDGIRSVEFSTDGGGTWTAARLGPNLGRFSFRRWHADWSPASRGMYLLLVRATNGANERQPTEPVWNRSGYMRNVVEQIRVNELP